METIERQNAPSRMTAAFEPRTAAPPPRRWPYRFWRGSVAFLTIASIAFALGGLIALRGHSEAGWRQAFSDFRWAVLVTGDRIELDEIGRYLNQLDGVAEVTLLPANAILDRLKNEPLLENHLSALTPSRLPSIWQVSWTPEFDLSSIDDTTADLRRLPGVVDIAFEKREIDKIRYFRGVWLKVRLVLAGLVLLAAVLGSLLLGRFLFFTDLSDLRPGPVAEIMFVAAAAWLAGLAMAHGIVGPFSGKLAWGALAAGVVRLAATHARRVE